MNKFNIKHAQADIFLNHEDHKGTLGIRNSELVIIDLSLIPKQNRLFFYKGENSMSKLSKTSILIFFGLVAFVFFYKDFASLFAGPGSDLGSTPSGQREFLLLDSRIIDKTENAKLTIGNIKKDVRNPLFIEDKPWEMRFDNLYANILYDEEQKLYKCWYSPFIIDPGTIKIPKGQRNHIKYPANRMGKREMGVCYAQSKDGIHWEKPNLSILDYDGNKNNNIVIRHAHGAGVFKDARTTDPNRRYKMIFKREKMFVSFSADGIYWDSPIECKGLNVAGDTHNNALWVPGLSQYVGITRMWGGDPRVRQVGRTSSVDFTSWSEAQVVLQGITPEYQVYALPVFFYKGVYLGLPAIFDTKNDRVWTELAWSTDTINWHRINPGTPFIANSMIENQYDWGCAYAAAYPIIHKDKILLYYGGSDGPHTGWRKGSLCLATIPKDGFAGYEPVDKKIPTTILTKPIEFKGEFISLCADVFDGGQILVTVLDHSYKRLAKGEPITESVTNGHITWPDPNALKTFGNKEIVLKFEFTKAKLWSFDFNESDF